MNYRVWARAYNSGLIICVTEPLPIGSATRWIMWTKLARAKSGELRDYWLQPAEQDY